MNKINSHMHTQHTHSLLTRERKKKEEEEKSHHGTYGKILQNKRNNTLSQNLGGITDVEN